jgi:hypothetical protein
MGAEAPTVTVTRDGAAARRSHCHMNSVPRSHERVLFGELESKSSPSPTCQLHSGKLKFWFGWALS